MLTRHKLSAVLESSRYVAAAVYEKADGILKHTVRIASQDRTIRTLAQYQLLSHVERQQEVLAYLQEMFGSSIYDVAIVDASTLQVVVCSSCEVTPIFSYYGTGIVAQDTHLFSMACAPIPQRDGSPGAAVLCAWYSIGYDSVLLATIRDQLSQGVQAMIGKIDHSPFDAVNGLAYALDDQYAIVVYTYTDAKQPIVREFWTFLVSISVTLIGMMMGFLAITRWMVTQPIQTLIHMVDDKLSLVKTGSLKIGGTDQWSTAYTQIHDDIEKLAYILQRYMTIIATSHAMLHRHTAMFKVLYAVEHGFSGTVTPPDERIQLTTAMRYAVKTFDVRSMTLYACETDPWQTLCTVDRSQCVSDVSSATCLDLPITIDAKPACVRVQTDHPVSATDEDLFRAFAIHVASVLTQTHERQRIADERNIFLSGVVVIFSRTVDWVVLNMTENLLTQCAIPASEMIGQSFLPFVHNNDRQHLVDCQRLCIETQHAQTITYTIDYQNNEIIVQEHMQYMPQRQCIMGYILNVTETMQAMQSLNRLKIAVESMNVGVCVSDKSGRIVYCNHYEANQHGYDPEQLLGLPVWTLGPSRLHVSDTVVIPDQTVRETVNVHRSGHEYPVMLRTSCLYDGDGGYTGKVVVSENITMQRRRERRLRQQNEELQSMSRTLAHDLLSPANWMSELTEILLTEYVDKLPKEANDLIGLLHDSAMRQVNVIEGARLIVKAGGKLERQPIDSEDPIRWGIEQLNGKAQHITFTIPSYSAMILADRIQLGRVFQNLIDNSYKYRVPSRPLMVTITRTIISGFLQYVVRDNGQGMSPEFVKRAGTLFARGAQDEAGLGVGLAFVKKIIHRHHGRIRIRSRENIGTVVTFTIPLAHTDEGKTY